MPSMPGIMTSGGSGLACLAQGRQRLVIMAEHLNPPRSSMIPSASVRQSHHPLQNPFHAGFSIAPLRPQARCHAVRFSLAANLALQAARTWLARPCYNAFGPCATGGSNTGLRLEVSKLRSLPEPPAPRRTLRPPAPIIAAALAAHKDAGALALTPVCCGDLSGARRQTAAFCAGDPRRALRDITGHHRLR